MQMKIKTGIKELWKEGFFEEHRMPSQVRLALKNRYGMNPANISMNLKNCKDFLRKENSGWIQKIRYSVKTQAEHNPPNELTLYNVVKDKYLLKACELNYKNANYGDMVFNGLRHLEVRVRKKGKLNASDTGADLIEKALKPNQGSLLIPCCATSGEADGFKLITKGIMQFHRNPRGHREESIDKKLALNIIGYVDYLLEIINTAELNSN